MSIILDGHKLAWHRERVEAWLAGERVAPITIDCALTTRCTYKCVYCLAGNTKILMADFTWKDIRDIQVGEVVMGFDEQAPKGHRRRFYPTQVTQVMKRTGRLHRLVSKEGERLLITKEHPVLTKRYEWQPPSGFKKADLRFLFSPYEDGCSETFDYKLGYLKGVLEGDGTFGEYIDKRDDHIAHKFKVDMTDPEPLERVKQYITDLFCVSVKGNKRVITLDSKELVDHLRASISWKQATTSMSRQFALGYLAGIFDAEGSISAVLRISLKTDLDTVGRNIEKAFETCNFSYVKEPPPGLGFRLTGGLPEIARFLGQARPSIKRKTAKVYNKCLRGQAVKVEHDRNASGKDVYNIETESHTYIANGFCVHNCYGTTQRHDGPQKLSRDATFRFLDDAAEIGVKAVSFVSDGESTCSPHLYDAILRGKSNGLDMALGTNGYLLKKERLEDVLPALTYLRFNVSAADLKRYTEIHGCPPWCYHRVMETIQEAVVAKRLNHLPVTIGLQMVLLPEFADQVLPLARLGREMGVDYLVIKHCSDDERGSLGVNYRKYSDLIPLLQQAEAMSTADYQVSAKWSKILSEGKRQYVQCYGPPLLAQFSGSGLVSPCGMLFNDRFRRFWIGNLNETPFKEMWQSDRYWEVMGELASERFDARTQCGSLCVQHKVNEYLWALKQGTSDLQECYYEPPPHVNFV